jgi:hypothetical protein
VVAGDQEHDHRPQASEGAAIATRPWRRDHTNQEKPSAGDTPLEYLILKTLAPSENHRDAEQFHPTFHQKTASYHALPDVPHRHRRRLKKRRKRPNSCTTGARNRCRSTRSGRHHPYKQERAPPERDRGRRDLFRDSATVLASPTPPWNTNLDELDLNYSLDRNPMVLPTS